MNQEGLLQGKVAFVSGASRGIGKGIAFALAEAGAIVYVTGRTLKKQDSTTAPLGTVHGTADLIKSKGGRSIAIQCDHSKKVDIINALAQVESEQGKLDILVNNAWAGYQTLQQNQSGFATKFWKHKDPEAFWDSMFDVGVKSHYITSAYAAKMMVQQQSGLLVNLTSGAGFKYRSSVAYGVSKASVNRMAADMAHELRKYKVAVVALCPGRTKTEMILSRKGDTTYNESTVFVGRSVVALAADPNVLEKSGEVFITRQLALEYGFTDVDGRQPTMDKGF